jgi:hypothetical protein
MPDIFSSHPILLDLIILIIHEEQNYDAPINALSFSLQLLPLLTVHTSPISTFSLKYSQSVSKLKFSTAVVMKNLIFV